MLIRRPVEDVFEAIVNPAITSKFWFSKGSGQLETGKTVRWEWESHDVSIEVTVKAIEPNRLVRIEWPGYSGPTEIEWTFRAIPDGTTFVRVQESGWTGDGDKLVRYVADSTQGFALMLAGLKAFLEHDIQLNLTLDRYPEGIEE
ncbi:polyketide cyclase [Mesorhizobium camelthorni]|uniref:Polyketide cyclase n=2 Tax=Allomesorhizobium camelthorni TaxID=475069 RepID=A0A6G4WPK8_9HYPH|nr:polyketide cyclase [Mesorhizobium camelthorni]